MPKEAPRLTMKDVAREAGVSVSTVSLALRNDPRLRESTCSRIRQIADDMGYRHDPALSALVAYRGRTRPPGDYGVLAALHDRDRPEARLPPSMFQTIQGMVAQTPPPSPASKTDHSYAKIFALQDTSFPRCRDSRNAENKE